MAASPQPSTAISSESRPRIGGSIPAIAIPIIIIAVLATTATLMAGGSARTIISVDGNVSEVRSPVIQAPFRTALDSVKQRAVGPVALGATTHVEVTCEEPTSCTAVFKITPGVR